MQIEVIADAKVSDTCDSSWGANDCPNKAEWLVKNLDNTGYAIMCDPHKQGFEQLFPNMRVVFYPYSAELNQQFAEGLKNGEENKL